MPKELENVMTNHFEKKHLIALMCIVFLTIVVWNLPTDVFHINGLTVIHQRIIAIFVFATLMWISEAIPSWATSLGIIALMCLTVSNHSLFFFKAEENEIFGKLLSSEEIMATFANPVIILFLGGFFLAIAATKSGLDVLLAKNLIRPFGRKSENVLLGFLLITGIFSMFVSNTATAAMMLTFLTPVFAALPASGKGRTALTMSIPIAANLGGMATPIGTPPNAIALQALNDPKGLNMGIDANTVALVPMGVFAATGVITAKDLQSINWSVIWMVAGGFALGLGINDSGLAKLAIDTIPFGSWSPIIVLIASGFICYLLSNFISNTAAAALLIPILVTICQGMGDRLGEIGGTSTVLIGIALAASSAMCLPISTPPNAIAYSTGLVKQNDMLKMGLIVGIISMIIGYLVLFLVGEMHFLN
ncbi:SLC13 family permease [Capnocytophaga leadbetteri]|uniref:SLC13 family permease n=1 Tax=Capnocytophaga leadbetteri TaxID=327575 RepID=UPI0028EEFFE0|nr:SLC13 family permease [Capnocytophaga leadbetteri]